MKVSVERGPPKMGINIRKRIFRPGACHFLKPGPRPENVRGAVHEVQAAGKEVVHANDGQVEEQDPTSLVDYVLLHGICQMTW